MEKLVYVAGPYTADDDWHRMQNINRAADVTAQLWAMHVFAICPHKITAFYGGLCDEKIFIEGGLELLRRCDAVVLVWGWEKSGGTLGEIKEAIRLDIPVYGSVKDLVHRRQIDYEKAQYYIDLWEKRKN